MSALPLYLLYVLVVLAVAENANAEIQKITLKMIQIKDQDHSIHDQDHCVKDQDCSVKDQDHFLNIKITDYDRKYGILYI